MKDESLVKRVLIALDCLFDTRLACISLISAAHAAEIMTKGYFERQSDEFWRYSDIDEQAYRELYKNRGTNPKVLENSMMTMFAAIALPSMVKELIKEVLESPFSSGFEIHINEYPHLLSDDERFQMAEVIKDFVGVDFEIKFQRLHPSQLTPGFVSNHYAMLTMYDYEEFIRAQGESLIKSPLTEVKLYGPAIFGQKVPNMEEMQEMMNAQVDPFSEVRLIASPMIDLELLPIANFSVIDINAHRIKEKKTHLDALFGISNP